MNKNDFRKTDKIHRYQSNNDVVLINCWHTSKILAVLYMSWLRTLFASLYAMIFSIEKKDRKILCAEGSFRFGEVCMRHEFPGYTSEQ